MSRPWSSFTVATPDHDDRIPFLDVDAPLPKDANLVTTLDLLQAYFANVFISRLWASTAQVVIANDGGSPQSIFSSQANGTLLLPGGFLTPHKRIRVKGMGILTQGGHGSPTNINLKIGASTIDLGYAFPELDGVPILWESIFACRVAGASGTIQTFNSVTGSSNPIQGASSLAYGIGTLNHVNTLVDQLLDITVLMNGVADELIIEDLYAEVIP